MSRVLQTRRSRVKLLKALCVLAWLALTPFSVMGAQLFATPSKEITALSGALLIGALVTQSFAAIIYICSIVVIAISNWLDDGTPNSHMHNDE